jgi:hypothetical protein
MRKLTLTIEDLRVDSFETDAEGRAHGTVNARSEETYYVSCMGETCAEGGCTSTDVVYACETNSCAGEMCDMSDWPGQCTWGGRGGDICGSFVC